MNKTDYIDVIIEKELQMFLAVPAAGSPSCREAPEKFKMHRSAQFSSWSEKTLASYLDDLRTAVDAGRNLMTYKYARMDELIPSENFCPYIPKILAAQIHWQKEVIFKYPKLMKNGRGLTDADESQLDISFERYLKAELESYSDRTLDCLWNDIEECIYKQINMSEQIYLTLAADMGFASLESFK